MRIFLGVAADDFTGASDAASLIASTGMPTILLNGIPNDIDSVLNAVYQHTSATVKYTDLISNAGLSAAPAVSCADEELTDTAAVCSIVIATKTRNLPAAEAVTEMLRCFDFLKRIGAEKLYFKYCATFDSTAAGNIGPVADAVLEKYGIPYTLIVPALPVNGRTVKDGILYVNGTPLAESHMKDHPLTPMHESELKKLMEMQSAYLTYNLSVKSLSDLNVPSTSYTDKQHFYLAPDYYEDEHGRLIAENFYELPFFTGGSGLCRELAAAYMRKHADQTRASSGLHMDKSCSAGSNSSSTVDSVMNNIPMGSENHITSTAAHDTTAAPCSIEATARTTADYSMQNAAVENKTAVVSAAVADTLRSIILAGSCSKVTLGQIAEFKADGGPSIQVLPHLLLNGKQTADALLNEAWAIGYNSQSSSAVLIYSSQSPEGMDESRQLGMERVSAAIEKLMGELAVNAVSEGCRSIICAGGETSGSIVEALGFDAFYIGESVAPGVPILIPVHDPSLRLVLKSGGFGQPDFFARAVSMTTK